MDILIFAIIAVILVAKLYKIIGNEDGFFNPQTDDLKVKEVNELTIAKNNDEDLNIIKDLDNDSILCIQEIKLIDSNFTIKKFTENLKEIAKTVISAISNHSIESLKGSVSEEMMENLKNIINTINNNISIISFNKIKIISVRKLDNDYYIDFDLDMLQNIVEKNGPISMLDVSERWIFKGLDRKTKNWVLSNISDNNE